VRHDRNQAPCRYSQQHTRSILVASRRISLEIFVRVYSINSTRNSTLTRTRWLLAMIPRPLPSRVRPQRHLETITTIQPASKPPQPRHQHQQESQRRPLHGLLHRQASRRSILAPRKRSKSSYSTTATMGSLVHGGGAASGVTLLATDGAPYSQRCSCSRSVSSSPYVWRSTRAMAGWLSRLRSFVRVFTCVQPRVHASMMQQAAAAWFFYAGDIDRGIAFVVVSCLCGIPGSTSPRLVRQVGTAISWLLTAFTPPPPPHAQVTKPTC